MDKSFEGLIFSIVVHIVLVLFLWNMRAPHAAVKDTTEITLVEKSDSKPKSKAKNFVTETAKKDPVEAIKDEADFLSAFTKRVKKQLRAAKTGPTVNAAPRPIPQINPSQHKGVAGLEPEREREEGVGRPGGGAANQPIQNVAIGESSLAEYIPGVEIGAFTALNSDQFTYYAFFSRMNEQVRYRWIANIHNFMSRLSPKELDTLSRYERQTEVEIILNPEGQITRTILQRTSGNRELDQTTIEAFKQAAPFPNPPHGMVESDGLIHLRYGFMVHFRPPSFGAG